jgi:hypothetical protein
MYREESAVSLSGLTAAEESSDDDKQRPKDEKTSGVEEGFGGLRI